MKVLVLGGMGLLGEALVQRCQALGHTTVSASRSSATLPLDIAERRQLAAALRDIKPELVINCAAIASFDVCEAAPGKAYAVTGSFGRSFIHFLTTNKDFERNCRVLRRRAFASAHGRRAEGPRETVALLHRRRARPRPAAAGLRGRRWWCTPPR